MPRVLHVITGLETGGAEMALYRLITSFRGENYTHAVVSLTPGGAMRQRFCDAGIQLTVLDFKKAPLSQFLRLVKLLRQVHPDIVQTWLYHADLLGGIAACLAGNRRVIWGVHTSSIKGSGTSAFTSVVRRLCAWASNFIPHTIVCVAEAARRAHIEVGYDVKRLVVVPNGFDLSEFVATPEERAALRAECGLWESDVVIGSLGRFNDDKDQRNFVCAAGLLARQSPDVRFLMVGKDLDQRNAELVGWISDTGHPECFLLLGERRDVPVCLAAMDIFCLHSRTEAFPLALGEAMAMGLPCVATDVGDAALMVGDTGVVVPKEDPEALARGLAQLLKAMPEQRRQLGQKAKARVQAEFTMECARRKFETIYRQVTEEGRR
jgi:glycosyltransferase involved in cell wall biosynthesis